MFHSQFFKLVNRFSFVQKEIATLTEFHTPKLNSFEYEYKEIEQRYLYLDEKQWIRQKHYTFNRLKLFLLAFPKNDRETGKHTWEHKDIDACKYLVWRVWKKNALKKCWKRASIKRVKLKTNKSIVSFQCNWYNGSAVRNRKHTILNDIESSITSDTLELHNSKHIFHINSARIHHIYHFSFVRVFVLILILLYGILNSNALPRVILPILNIV